MSVNREDTLASNADYAAREVAMGDPLVKWAKDNYNVNLSRDALWESPAFRLFVMTGEIFGDLKEELVRDNDAIRQSAKTIEMQKVLNDAENPQHDALMAEINALPPHQRMQKAREMGLDGGSAKESVQKVHDPVERARIIAEVNKLPLSMRISAARARGVT